MINPEFMEYDAKKLPLAEMESTFSQSLNQLNNKLHGCAKVNQYDADIFKRSVDKILECVNELSPGAATQLVSELENIINIASNRVNEVNILTNVLVSKKYISDRELFEIAYLPEMGRSCNLTEDLLRYVPLNELGELQEVGKGGY